MLKTDYSELSKESIMKMSESEAKEALIRATKVRYVNAEHWIGKVIIPDELADAIRNRGDMVEPEGVAAEKIMSIAVLHNGDEYEIEKHKTGPYVITKNDKLVRIVSGAIGYGIYFSDIEEAEKMLNGIINDTHTAIEL